MPKSKRAKVTTLTKTPLRTTKASKLALANELRNEIDSYQHVWLFDLGDMRNDCLKELRGQWRGSGRFFFGRGRVMAKALGEEEETEHESGLSELAKRIQGSMGLFMTSYDVAETKDWFDTWSRKEYARSGATADKEVVLPAGPILTPYAEPPSGDPFPHSMEPQLRALGLASSLVRGVPSLSDAHVVCRAGDKLTSEQCRLLKLLGVQMAEFRVHLGARWSRGVGFVKEGTTEQEE